MNVRPAAKIRDRVSLESLLHRTTQRILQSLELPDILAATVAEVCSFLETDRVMIYKFHPDGSGQVVAESIQNHRLPSLLGLNFPSDDIPPHTRQLFVKAKVKSVVDVGAHQIGQSFLRDPETGEVVPDDLQYRTVDPCHVEYLQAMGVQSSVVVPILHYEQLWGLLVSHHSESRSIPASELQAVQMVVDQLAVAIAQSALLLQTREKAHLEAIVNRIATLLRSRAPKDLQAALEATVTALQGSGGRLYVKSTAFEIQDSVTGHLVKFQETATQAANLYITGTQPVTTEPFVLEHWEQSRVLQDYLQAHEQNIWTIPDL